MERRRFLTSSLAASALAVAAPGSYAGAAQAGAQGRSREFYQLRRYHIISGPQRKLCDDFFRDALIPALTRLGIGPVGVMRPVAYYNLSTLHSGAEGLFAQKRLRIDHAPW
jgi:hypothetical protein